ncbi:MAG: AAA family ATPase, partial [Thiothrix sp.]
MSKSKLQYYCTACGSLHTKWSGQCSDCGAWNTLEESVSLPTSKVARSGSYAGEQAVIRSLHDVSFSEDPRIPTHQTELDRVLGGGLVAGSVVLIGGDPGIGKSTILLQTLAALGELRTLYVTGEESLQQVGLRAKRLSLPTKHLRLLTETCVESILTLAVQEQPRLMVIDSIQTIFTDTLQSAPGSASQIREAAAKLVRFAKQTQTAMFLVGHVTKEGTLAGPRVLEHMVDTV